MAYVSVKWQLKQIVSDRIIQLDANINMIGRSENAKVCLRSGKSSRVHAQLIINPDRNLQIFDLKSSNGTFVNGRIIPISGQLVSSGDTLSFGLATIDLSEDRRDKECFFTVMRVKETKSILPGAADSTTNAFDDSVVFIEIDDDDPEEFVSDIPHASTPVDASLESIISSGKPLENSSIPNKNVITSEIRTSIGDSLSNLPNEKNSRPERLSARIATRRLTVTLEDNIPHQHDSNKISTKFTEGDLDNICIEINSDVFAIQNNLFQPKLGPASTSRQDYNSKLDAGSTKIVVNNNPLSAVNVPENNFVYEAKSVENIANSETAALKTFSTNDQSNCVLIDLTKEEDDDMDISNSQIFHMSQIVSTDVQDDKYMQIKNELAKMDFCTDEVIINHVPINLEDNEEESGFQNTQDIWELLEDGVDQANNRQEEVQATNPDAKERPVSPEIDFSGNGVEDVFPSKPGSSTLTALEGNDEDTCKLNATKSTKKREKGEKLQIIEAHTIKPPEQKTRRSLTGSDKTATKRKTSIDSPIKKKKAKSTGFLNVLNFCKKDLQIEIKKRKSPVKATIDKAAKQSILEDRRKRLKELSSPKGTESDKTSANIPSTSKKDENVDQQTTTPSTPVKRRIARRSSTKQTAPIVEEDIGFGIMKDAMPPPVLREPPVVKQAAYDLRRTKSSEEIKLPRENSTRNAKQNAANLVRRSEGLIVDIAKAKVRPQIAAPIRIDSRNRVAQKGAFSANIESNQEAARRLMWTNGGPGRKPPPSRPLPRTDDITKKMIQWLPSWLLEQVNIDASPPINNPPATKVPVTFRDFDHYYQTFSKLILLETWQYLFNGFRETKELPRKVKIDHMRVSNDLTILDCTCYITKKELKQELFYRPDDFLMLECAMKAGTNIYTSLNFGFVQNCRKTTLTDNSIISLKRDLCGDPHTELKFTVVTRYQPDMEMNTKRMPIVKVLSNVRTYLMLIKTIKGLASSPLCSMILNPQIRDYKITTTHYSVKHKNKLNAEQKNVVLEAASLCTGNKPGIYCVKGPPGTGKSTVIANLIFQIIFSHYFEKRTNPPMILLVAPSNTAVDNLISKMMSVKHEFEPEKQVKIKCVRIGPESSINKNVIGYSLHKLAEKHMPIKHQENAEIWAGKQKGQTLIECLRNYFGDQYNHELKLCENIIIAKSNIICTTLNSCINGRLIDAVNRGLLQFTCCIIDEATQCHEVEALLPTLLGIDKFVLVGDPQQLSATIMNRDAFKLGFGQSLFSRLVSSFGSDPRSPVRMLTEQYRMHSEICSFPNRQFYKGKLRSKAKPANKLPEEIRPYLVFNLEWVNNSKEYTNMGEICVIKKLLTSITSLVDGSCQFTIGIITPYRAQKDLICHNITDIETKNNNCKIIANTVDSFQGSENDVIIISCVRESSNSFLQNECRLNVALTRAKQALYIIGNYSLFKECRPLYDLREDAKKRKVLLDIRTNPEDLTNFDRYLFKRRNSRGRK